MWADYSIHLLLPSWEHKQNIYFMFPCDAFSFMMNSQVVIRFHALLILMRDQLFSKEKWKRSCIREVETWGTGRGPGQRGGRENCDQAAFADNHLWHFPRPRFSGLHTHLYSFSGPRPLAPSEWWVPSFLGSPDPFQGTLLLLAYCFSGDCPSLPPLLCEQMENRVTESCSFLPHP